MSNKKSKYDEEIIKKKILELSQQGYLHRQVTQMISNHFKIELLQARYYVHLYKEDIRIEYAEDIECLSQAMLFELIHLKTTTNDIGTKLKINEQIIKLCSLGVTNVKLDVIERVFKIGPIGD